MTDYKYGTYPEKPTDTGQWVTLSLQVRVDNYQINWAEVDLRLLAEYITRFFGTQVGYAAGIEPEDPEYDPVRIYAKKMTAQEQGSSEVVTDDDIRDFLKSQE